MGQSGVPHSARDLIRDLFTAPAARAVQWNRSGKPHSPRPTLTRQPLFSENRFALTAERERHSKFNTYLKSYESAAGTEQRFGRSGRGISTDGQAARQRWENEGGTVVKDPPPVDVEALRQKPAWSVLSLEDLTEKIRQGKRPDDPWRMHEESQRVERDRLAAIELREQRVANAARAKRNRYRNPWEND